MLSNTVIQLDILFYSHLQDLSCFSCVEALDKCLNRDSLYNIVIYHVQYSLYNKRKIRCIVSTLVNCRFVVIMVLVIR